MSDATGLLALGQALDDYLSSEYAPPPGTQTALGFVPGVAVNPSSFSPTGVVNPMAVQTFLNVVTNLMGPVVDGRFSGFLSAATMYGALINMATPLDPLGTPAADAFLRVVNTARSAFGGNGPKELVAVPLNWYDATSTGGWSTYTTTSSEQSGEGQSSTSGTGEPPTDTLPDPHQSPPIIDQTRFEKMWRFRTLDETAIAEVVVPTVDPPVAVEVTQPPVVVAEQLVKSHQPVVRDHVGVDLSETSVRTKGRVFQTRLSASSADLLVPSTGRLQLRAPTLAAGFVATPLARTVDDDAAVRVLAAGSRRQLVAALAQDNSVIAGDGDLAVSQALAHLIRAQSPAVVAEIDDDRETTSTQSMETNELTLSLEYCFVQISRDGWWNDAVLRMPRWYAPGQKAGEFSSGTAVGGLPLGVPIAMVLTRNVSVSGRWTESDRTAAESHTSLGPWSMQDSQMAYDASSETATLTMPSMQVVAVVCAVLPALPPSDDPSLPAAAPDPATH
ncbi:hypothetical protein [uncultured Friedmanniella sp.]|uniref:hypothetical protein n=1 Tax=uncultured Friedmanniella sp. TaxID=335381 RepID=UPI0035CB75ED